MYKSTRQLSRLIASRINLNNSRYLSITAARKNESSIQERINFNTNIVRVHDKKPQRKPLVKNFFVGEVDKELLAYPEVVRDENLVNLYKKSESYKSLLNDQIFSRKSEEVPENLEKLKHFGSLGLTVSEHFNGQGYLCTETLYSNEIEAQNLSIGNFLCNHRLVTQLIDEFGNEQQKNKFLPSLVNGDSLGTVAFYENQVPKEKKSFCLEAKFRDTDNSWIINGEKSFVVNPNKNSLLLAFASTESVDHIGDFKECVTAFLIDGSTAGVKIENPDQIFGLRDVKQCRVSFQDVVIPEGNIK